MDHIGKHALVTGGGTGIGASIAVGLADAGAQVTITGRRAQPLADLAAQHPNIHPMQMDVSDQASVTDGINAASAARGPITICVANAGIAQGGRFADTTLADWRRTMAINLDGVFLTLQGALATLAADTPARMIVISSIAGLRGLKNAVPYTASKHAVIGLIRGLSEEYIQSNVTFNAICPGYVDTDIVRNQIPGLMRRFDTDAAGATARIAQGNRNKRLLHVDEITATAMWLCSDGARAINGQTIQISGGQV